MAKTAKRIKYRNAQLPEDLGKILANADENDLKILIALMMVADENGEREITVGFGEVFKLILNKKVKIYLNLDL